MNDFSPLDEINESLNNKNGKEVKESPISQSSSNKNISANIGYSTPINNVKPAHSLLNLPNENLPGQSQSLGECPHLAEYYPFPNNCKEKEREIINLINVTSFQSHRLYIILFIS